MTFGMDGAYRLCSASITRCVGDILVGPVFLAQILGPRKVLLRTRPADKVCFSWAFGRSAWLDMLGKIDTLGRMSGRLRQ